MLLLCRYFMLFSLICLFFQQELTAEEAEKKQRVCLNMIVKNESHVIKRCLENVKPLVDSWVIVDTGSTDGTQEIIKECMKDLPGELYERPWVNFAHNREEAMQLAKANKKLAADYLFIMDADDFCTKADDFRFPKLTADAYYILMQAAETQYYCIHLVNTKTDWHWYGVLHESLDAPEPKTKGVIEGIKIMCTHEGARSKDPKKYEKDAAILEEALKNEPDNARYAYYLARSYDAARQPEKAIACYEKRAQMGGWGEEVFCSLLQAARLRARLQEDPKNQIDPKIVDESFIRAFTSRPIRAEPLYDLATRARRANQFQKGYEIAELGLKIKKPGDALFVDTWIYDYGLLFEHSICAYWIGKYKESLQDCDRLLGMQNLPESFRGFVVKNRVHALAKIEEEERVSKIVSLFPEVQNSNENHDLKNDSQNAVESK